MGKLKSLIIDTNLLLLYIMGNVDGGTHITKSKRLQKFKDSDYQKIIEAISLYDTVLTTPYIVTEVSNLIDLKGVLHQMMMEEAREVIKFLSPIPVDPHSDVDGHFPTYGITDNSLLTLVADHVVLTDDMRLATELFKVKSDNV